jgi:hypothetical protein
MRWLSCAAPFVIFGASGAALEQTVAVVHSASATYGAGRTIVVRATVDLPNSCWSNPRFMAPSRGVRPDADGVVPILIVAKSMEGSGVMCSMVYRPDVSVPAFRWTHYPAHGLKAVKLIGTRTTIVATVGGDGQPGTQH